MKQLKLAVFNIFQKIKVIWVLQPIVYRGSCFIQTGSGKGFYDTWTALCRCITKLIWNVL